jgi:hypothetical protein
MFLWDGLWYFFQLAKSEFVVFAQRIWVLEFAPPFLIPNYLYLLGGELDLCFEGFRFSIIYYYNFMVVQVLAKNQFHNLKKNV